MIIFVLNSNTIIDLSKELICLDESELEFLDSKKTERHVVQ